MQILLTNQTASLTELREPRKVISKAGNKPVAIFDRNKVVGYYVPIEAIEKLQFELATDDEVTAALQRSLSSDKSVYEYLRDK